MKIATKIKSFLSNNITPIIIVAIAILCATFMACGTRAEDGSITLDGQNAKIEEYTTSFIESANTALNRLMNADAPTDAAIVEQYKNGFEDDEGLGGSATLEAVLSRRRSDGDNDSGNGWQCSKYTAYLATGRKDYSSAHPDYGPVNGKNVAEWLVANFGWKYVDEPVAGAIGSGGFNTLYGHTAMFLYWISDSVAMVNDANYAPLAVATHPMDTSGWLWVVPGDYTPDVTPTPEPTPTPDTPISYCALINVASGDTMGGIMERCKGYVEHGEAMNVYAKSWYSTIVKPGQSVYDGWTSPSGVGLYAGDTIEYKGGE